MKPNGVLSVIAGQSLGSVPNIDLKPGDVGYSNPVEFGVGLDKANVVTSLVQGDQGKSAMLRKHKVLLDLDVPAYLVPSSTEGNSHLYIDVECSQRDYFDLLDALAKCGVIEHGYRSASQKRGATALRLPWVKKTPKTKEVSPWGF